MATGEPSVFSDFKGGVNLVAGPYLVEDTEARDARNVHGSVIGSIRKRPGFEKLGTDTLATLDGPPHSLFPVNLGTKSLLVVAKQASASSDRIVSMSLSGAPTTLKSGLSQGKRWSFVQAPVSGGQGPVYGINGTDTPQYWDGSSGATVNWTATTGTVPINARFLIYHMDVLWAAGDPANPARVQSCGLSGATPVPDPRNWDTDYMDEVGPADGQPVTALGSVGPYLLVAKARKLYAMPDFQSRAYREVSSSIGCIAHRTMVETSRGTMFLSEDLGVCVTDGQTVRPISDPVLPLLREAAEANALLFANACATYFQGSYFLSIPAEASHNDLTLEFQLDTDAWWIHTCSSNQFALIDPTGQPVLFSANTSVKQVDRAFVPGVYGDYGEAFSETFWKSAFLTWGNPHLNKRLREFRVDGLGEWNLFSQETFEDEPTLLDGPVRENDRSDFDFGGIGDFGGVTDEFGPAAGITQRSYPTPSQGWGRAWSLTLTNDDPSPMEVFSLAAFVLPRSD